jgi:hypothetical protein
MPIDQTIYSILFPSLGILQRYIEFDARTTTMLKKLLGPGSFGTTMGHLVHCQIIFFVSLGGLGLPLAV